MGLVFLQAAPSMVQQPNVFELQTIQLIIQAGFAGVVVLLI